MTEILSLSTMVKRDTISLESKLHPDGKIYEVANAADFGPYEYAMLQQRSGEAQELLAKKKRTPKDEHRIEQLTDETINMIVRDLEPRVLRELTIQQKHTIVFAWIAHASEGAAEGKAPSRRTGGGSSRASKASTAATSRRGGTRRSGS